MKKKVTNIFKNQKIIFIVRKSLKIYKYFIYNFFSINTVLKKKLFLRPTIVKQKIENICLNILRRYLRSNLFKFNNNSFTSKAKYKRSNKRYFCTYGDDKFIKSRERIVIEAERTGLFDNCFFYTDISLPGDEFFNVKQDSKLFCEVASSERIGGCGLWKPYILFNTLKELNDGDILVYSDAGCTIKTDKNSINQLEDLISEIEKSWEGIIAVRNSFIEQNWTKGDVFEYFEVYNDSNFTNTKQFSSGRLHIAKKCKHALSIYSQWWEIAKVRPELFSDSPSLVPNLSGFIENRHDQSIWSLLCKKFSVIEKKDLDLFPIEPSRICK